MRLNRRYRPYKKGPLPFRYVMLLAILFFVLSTVISLFFINRSIKPTLIHIAELETERIANHLIQYSVQDFADDQENMKDMVVMNTSENGKVTTIDFNAQATSKAMADLSRHLQKNLEDIEKGNFQKEAKEALRIKQMDMTALYITFRLGKRPEMHSLPTSDPKCLYALV